MEKFTFRLAIKFLLFTLIFSTLTACGGGGGDNSGKKTTSVNTATLEGVFLDGRVSGMSYNSGSLSGFTDENGTFSYEQGATITFKVGDIVLGTAKAVPVMTPISLVAGAIDETHPGVVNIVRFLVTVDDDADPENGVQITSEIHTRAKGLSLDFTLVGNAFDAASNVQNVIAFLTEGKNPLASEQVAKAHFKGTLMGLIAGIYNGTYSGDDAGTWSIQVSSNGIITGSGCSTATLTAFEINGAVSSNGELSSFGFASNGNFLGRFDFSGNFSGDWIADSDTGTYSGSKTDSRSGAVCPNNPPQNTPPVANAGTDQSVITGTTVSLNGNKSSDGNSDPLTYQWVIVSKPFESTSTLFDAATANASFIPDTDGTYVISLMVNDGTSNSVLDSMSIGASTGIINAPPIADAGADRTVVTGMAVTLDGSKSSDADGDSLTYQWSSFGSRRGAAAAKSNIANLIDAATVNASFTPDVDGTYIIKLIVNDGKEDSSADTVTITAATEVINVAPVANAGLDKTALVNASIFLDGSKSSDVNGDPLTYIWSFASKPSGSTTLITDPSAVKASFIPDVIGEYVLQLRVSDGVNESVTDLITITSASKVGFNSDGLAVYSAVVADFASYDSADISITAPDIAENGAIVPLTIKFPSQVSRLWLFIESNDDKLAATADFLVPDDNGFLSTRVKMKKTGDIVVVISDGAGNLIAARKNIKVTIGGFGTSTVDCALINCTPVFDSKNIKVKEKSGIVKMLIRNEMNAVDFIENLSLQVDGIAVFNMSTTPNISKNPFFSFKFTAPLPGTTSDILITVNATGSRSSAYQAAVTP